MAASSRTRLADSSSSFLAAPCVESERLTISCATIENARPESPAREASICALIERTRAFRLISEISEIEPWIRLSKISASSLIRSGVAVTAPGGIEFTSDAIDWGGEYVPNEAANKPETVDFGTTKSPWR